MLQSLKRILSDSGSSNLLVECRHCGANPKEGADTCPGCGSSELAEYQL